MERNRERVKGLLGILESIRKNYGPASYEEVISHMAIGYERWYGKLQKNVESEKEDISYWVLLPVHIERAYEILYENGFLSKEELHDFRKQLICWYVDELYESDPCQIKANINGNSLEEICEKARLYSRVLDFYFRDQPGSPTTGYISEAMRHIEAMAAKIELDLEGVNDHGGSLDRDVLSSLASAYDSLAEEFSLGLRQREKELAALALKEIEELFVYGD